MKPLDDAYANAPYIPGAEDYPPRWTSEAAAFRAELGERAETGVSYGDTARQVFDFFNAPSEPAGTVVFVHGGYWKAFDHTVWSHFATGAIGRGWSVAMPGYDLCPDVRVRDITRQIARAIMAIAARSGVSGVKISKVHAAYSLGASKWQIMRHVIIPNSLPEIFTGARVAMGVCWGTVVAAELVAAEQGAGMMIMTASKFQNTDIVIMGIILIGVIGFGIDMLMRWAERLLVPWKGKG